MIVDPKKISTKDLHQFLLGSVAPRPIAFASTVNEAGISNLAPYSFFNAFSSNPPIVVFSSNRRVLDNTTKDTLHNVETTREVVINVVTYDIVRQMAISSIQYPEEVNEFDKAGLTPIPSDLVAPPRVKESPVNMECVVKDIITLGEHGGAGHLIISEVVRMHIADHIIDERNRIDPHKIDLMGRMGRAYYVRASGSAIHTIVQPVTKIAIGFDQLPKSALASKVLTGNDLGQLAGVFELPSEETVLTLKHTDDQVGQILASTKETASDQLHQYAKELLEANEIDRAMQIVMLADLL